MGLFTDAARDLFRALSAADPVPLAYTRGTGPGSACALTGYAGTTTFEQTNQYGSTEAYTARDWLVLAADLVPTGAAEGTAPWIPKPGDRIAAAGQVFEVMAPAFRPSDAAGVVLRIHTKRIS